MFFAAPIPTGIDSAMPITVETTVIQRLSSMPSAISLQRLTKSGGKNAEKNFTPARQALPDAGPVHLGGAERQREIDRGAECQRPAQPGALDHRGLLPAARGW